MNGAFLKELHRRSGLTWKEMGLMFKCSPHRLLTMAERDAITAYHRKQLARFAVIVGSLEMATASKPKEAGVHPVRNALFEETDSRRSLLNQWRYEG